MLRDRHSLCISDRQMSVQVQIMLATFSIMHLMRSHHLKAVAMLHRWDRRCRKQVATCMCTVTLLVI